MKVAIFFGGRSREREVSFAGGRTVYDMLDKSLFTPVPVFADSLGNFIVCDWKYLYKGTVRDFYPPSSVQPNGQLPHYIESFEGDSAAIEQAIAATGQQVFPHQFSQIFDFAFLCLHGAWGEDGTLQGMLEYFNIPYSGSGILPSAIGIDKSVQKHLISSAGVATAPYVEVKRADFLSGNWKHVLAQAGQWGKIVVKPASQGSSIGVTILEQPGEQQLQKALEKAFFIRSVSRGEYSAEGFWEKFQLELLEVYTGIGLPVATPGGEVLYKAGEVRQWLDKTLAANEAATLSALSAEHTVVVEKFIKGREFSCIVIEDGGGQPIALPPTEIVKKQQLFHYQAKYLPGQSQKITPMAVAVGLLDDIRRQCVELYRLLHFNVYARIDGIMSEDGTIFLNDPNTTSGMMPSSFFFHQAAEVGLSPGQFITYIVHASLRSCAARFVQARRPAQWLEWLTKRLIAAETAQQSQKSIAVVFGGNSTERHISVESGRNVFEKLSSTGRHKVAPIFLVVEKDRFRFFRLPYNLMLKDNADDIAHAVLHPESHPLLDEIRQQAKAITHTFGTEGYSYVPEEMRLEDFPQFFDFVFLALHGRPGEDGQLQRELEKLGLPYNGSEPHSASLTINKYQTNEVLLGQGLLIPAHAVVEKDQWLADENAVVQEIESRFRYPLISKPADDGCSSAVIKIRNREQLAAYAKATFRETEEELEPLRETLGIDVESEFPPRSWFLVEEMVSRNGADYFLEVTGGMLIGMENGQKTSEVFEPSEALASGGILTLAEKFLAGEGQNITPARYTPSPDLNQQVSSQVKEQLRQAAEAADVYGYCRIDAFVRIFQEPSGARAETVIIEINSLPGLTPATCIFHQAALNGYKPAAFLEKIIANGEKKQAREQTAPQGH